MEEEPLIQFFTVVTPIIVASIAGAVSWYKVKTIIPFSEQERYMREIISASYDNKYVDAWRKLRSEIDFSKNSSDIDYKEEEEISSELEKIEKGPTEAAKIEKKNNYHQRRKEKLDNLWDIVGKKQFPETIRKSIEKKHEEDVVKMLENRGIKFVKENPKIIIKAMQQKADIEYFKRNNELLPQMVLTAVRAAYNPKPFEQITEKDIDLWISDSIENLKWILIYNGIAEHEEVLKIMAKAEINKIVSKKSLE